MNRSLSYLGWSAAAILALGVIKHEFWPPKSPDQTAPDSNPTAAASSPAPATPSPVPATPSQHSAPSARTAPAPLSRTSATSGQSSVLPPLESWKPSFLSITTTQNQNQVRLIEDSSSSWHNIEAPIRSTASLSPELMILLRPDTGRNARFFAYTNTGRIICILDADNGQIDTVTTGNTSDASCRGQAINDGWWELSLSGRFTEPNVIASVGIVPKSSAEVYEGDGRSGMDVALP